MRRSWRLLSLACLVLACAPEETSSSGVTALDPDGWRARAQDLFPGLAQSLVADLEPSGAWWCAGAEAELELEDVADGVWALTDAWDETRPPVTVVCIEGVLVPVEPLTWLGPEPVSALFPVRALDGVWLVPDCALPRIDFRAPERREFVARAFRFTGRVEDDLQLPLQGF